MNPEESELVTYAGHMAFFATAAAVYGMSTGLGGGELLEFMGQWSLLGIPVAFYNMNSKHRYGKGRDAGTGFLSDYPFE